MVSPRSKVLLVLGLSEDDIKTSETLFQQLPMPPINPGRRTRLGSPDQRKVETLMGYATLSLQREKALKVLGTTEEDIVTENSKSLGALGLSGRRRSYLVIPNSVRYNNQYFPSAKCLYKHRRRSLEKKSLYPICNSKRRRARKLFWRSSSGHSYGSKMLRDEDNRALYIKEMNQLKTSLFQTQVEMSRLHQRIQCMETKSKKN